MQSNGPNECINLGSPIVKHRKKLLGGDLSGNGDFWVMKNFLTSQLNEVVSRFREKTPNHFCIVTFQVVRFANYHFS